MKRSELTFSFLLVPLDYIMIVLAGVSAYYIRFSKFTTDIRPAIFDLKFGFYFEILLAVAALWIIIFGFAGLYNIRSARKIVQEFYRVVLACSTGFMLVVIFIFLQRELFESRFIILAVWVLSIFYITTARAIVRMMQRYLFSLDIGVHKIILIGKSKTSEILKKNFLLQKKSGFKIVKEISSFSHLEKDNLLKYIRENEVDEILQCNPNLDVKEKMRLYSFADENHIDYKYVADLFGTKILKTEVSQIAGIPIVEIKKTPLDGWGRIVKRFFDITVSTILLIIVSPILIFTAICIKLDSRGSVFFSKKDDNSQLKRIGQGGKAFHYFKFRSMKPCTDNLRYTELADRNTRGDGPMVKIENDPRVTRIGRFIRKYSIDELPELFLVLKGVMSLVGPRPHLPEEVAKYEVHHKKVLTIKPGITGMAQISGRSDLDFDEEVKLDMYYIENWSLLFDLSILLRTPMAILKNRNAD
ncbi:sugar transferase [Candidatus Parcubacteria bacterium]|nr:sugar transferase [Candidatus Parcubacteria bacterium]